MQKGSEAFLKGVINAAKSRICDVHGLHIRRLVPYICEKNCKIYTSI